MDERRKNWQNPELIMEQIGVMSGWTVADIGCGPGYFTSFFSKKVGTDGVVYAVDSSPLMLEKLRANIEKLTSATMSNLRTISSDASRTMIPLNSVDCVFLADVLHDIDDKRSLFSEITRILKVETGCLVDIDWHKRETEFGPPVEIRLSEEQTRKLMSDSGFRIIRMFNAGRDHYGFISSRKKSVDT